MPESIWRPSLTSAGHRPGQASICLRCASQDAAHTGSMIPTLQPGEAIVDQPVRGRPHRGEIITFRYASGPDQVVTHRVYRESGGTIRTKGDANPTEDPWTLRASQVVGIPTAIIPTGATSSST
jgi:signal peptidase I